jgi:hypothetical protein
MKAGIREAYSEAIPTFYKASVIFQLTSGNLSRPHTFTFHIIRALDRFSLPFPWQFVFFVKFVPEKSRPPIFED